METKSVIVDMRTKEEKKKEEKKIIAPKVKSIRKEVEKWRFDNKFLELDKQWECLEIVNREIANRENMDLESNDLIEENKNKKGETINSEVLPVCRELRRQIQNKISSYKMQDIQKKKFDTDKFVNLEFVISLLYEKGLKCFYCKESVYLFYNYVRENKQWTLERIDNNSGHNMDNVEIACLLCNLRRRTMYHERYVFTKQMNVVKKCD